MSILYVGADVHKESTVFHTLKEDGSFASQLIVPTEAGPIISHLTSLEGTVHLAFEEGTQAHWLYNLLKSRVAKVVVCDPSRSSAMLGKKPTDEHDARGLAELLRAGLLSPVFHDFGHVEDLKELVRSYYCHSADLTRAKNQIKAIFRGQGIRTEGTAVYSKTNREVFLKQLPSHGIRTRTQSLYALHDILEPLVAEARQEVTSEVRKYTVYRYIKTVPGFGPIRSAVVLAHVAVPERFPCRQAFWSYCGLMVRSQSSANRKIKDNKLVWDHKSMKTRGLTRKRNPYMKDAFKGAATTAVQHNNEFKEYWNQLVERGLNQKIATVCVARKLATIVLTVWKKSEEYNPEEVKKILKR